MGWHISAGRNDRRADSAYFREQTELEQEIQYRVEHGEGAYMWVAHYFELLIPGSIGGSRVRHVAESVRVYPSGDRYRNHAADRSVQPFPGMEDSA